MEWDGESRDATESQQSVECEKSVCYCGRERDLENGLELQCLRCLRWFHAECVATPVGRVLPFITNYAFGCRDCGQETFARRQTNFGQMCETALANLMVQFNDKMAFSMAREIIPFVEKHWESLTTMPRRVKHTWHTTVQKTLQKETETFIADSRDQNDPHFALRNRDLARIQPNYEPETGQGRRGAKRRVDDALLNRKQKSELATPRLPPQGFPAEFPYNKDGYRYVLAEPDPHGPHRQEFEDSQDLAGKPIPGWLCRKLCPQKVVLSLHDRAPQLKVSEDRLAVVGDKGYCMVRANYGVSHGNHFFEVRVDETPDSSALRLGVCQEWANLQAPLGYDAFAYSVRSRKGTRFHESRGRHFAEEGFSAGDTLGFLVSLPGEACPRLPPTYKDKPLVKFKSYLYFEEKDEIARQSRQQRPLAGSRLTVWKNGRLLGHAFHDLNQGHYYPAASLYRGASVTFNFGPEFAHAPADEAFEPMSAVVDAQQVEQTLADVLYLVENEGRLRLDIFYGN